MAVRKAVSFRERLGPRLVFGAVLAVACYYGIWGGEYSSLDLLRLHSRQHATQTSLSALRVEIDSLHDLAAHLQSDSATIERIARERFGMIRDGELLYRFVKVPEGE